MQFVRREPDDIESAGFERLTICFVLFEGTFKIRRAQIDSCQSRGEVCAGRSNDRFREHYRGLARFFTHQLLDGGQQQRKEQRRRQQPEGDPTVQIP